MAGQGLRLALLGIAIGGLAAYPLTPLLRSFLFGVGPNDPFIYAAVSGLLLLVAGLACWLPAQRATQLDPVRSLRAE